MIFLFYQRFSLRKRTVWRFVNRFSEEILIKVIIIIIIVIIIIVVIVIVINNIIDHPIAALRESHR